MEQKCNYCGDCLPCAMHIDLPEMMKLYERAKAEGVTEALRADIAARRHGPDECIRCLKCIRRCPFSLRVPDMLRELVLLLRGESL